MHLQTDKINVTEKLQTVFGKVENIVGKGENAGYQCFQKDSFSGSLKVRTAGKGQCSSLMQLYLSKSLHHDQTVKSILSEPFPIRQILDSSKKTEFADNSFKFDESSPKR